MTTGNRESGIVNRESPMILMVARGLSPAQSPFPIPESRLIHDSRLPIHDSRLPIHDSRLPIHDSRFPIHD
jgi:hypothetical protein